MTISKPKPIEEILDYLCDAQRVFLIGCSDCATVCLVGGKDQLEQMAATLAEHGKEVTGTMIGEPGCHLLELKRLLRQHKAEVDAAQAVLVMSCGTGTQTAAAVLEDKDVFPATDTLFLGSVQRFGQFAEYCSACGECVLERTGGICPVTRCAKGLLNGPCGGTSAEGKCEVDPEQDCAWKLIYERAAKRGRLERLARVEPAKEHAGHPGRRIVEREGGAA